MEDSKWRKSDGYKDRCKSFGNRHFRLAFASERQVLQILNRPVNKLVRSNNLGVSSFLDKELGEISGNFSFRIFTTVGTFIRMQLLVCLTPDLFPSHFRHQSCAPLDTRAKRDVCTARVCL